jgi:ankyrin repeat protein
MAAADAKDLQAPPVSVTVTGSRITKQDAAAPPSPVAAPSVDSTSGLTSPAPQDAQIGSPAVLLHAAETGDLKSLQASLDQLTDINSRDAAGRTPLLLATLHGQTNAVTTLLAHGADPNAADASGMTPLQAATHGGNSAIIKALKHAGAH